MVNGYRFVIRNIGPRFVDHAATLNAYYHGCLASLGAY